MVLENELRKEIEQFEAYFKVHVIIDSCYSEGLDADYVNLFDLGEESFSPVYYYHKNDLDTLINNYPSPYIPGYIADTCFIYSVEQNIPAVLSSKLNTASLFTSYLIDLWNNYVKPADGINLNYPEFVNRLMKSFIRSPFCPVIRIYPSKSSSSNFFISTAFLKFNQYPETVNESFLKINLDEDLNNKKINVRFEGLYPSYEAKNAAMIWDKKIDGYSDDWSCLANKIRALNPYLLDDIDYVIQVFVELSENAPKPFNTPITQIRPISSSINKVGGIGLVIICDSINNNKIIGHKRTKGKVSNKLG